MSELVEKVAEMPDLPTRTVQLTGITKSERPDIQFEPAPDAAPVCVWERDGITPAFFVTPHGRAYGGIPFHECPSCGKPISFKSEAQR